MVAKEVFVNYGYNFNPTWEQHASVDIKKYMVLITQVKKGNCQGILQNLLEPEPKEILLAPQHWKQLNELMSQVWRRNWTIW